MQLAGDAGRERTDLAVGIETRAHRLLTEDSGDGPAVFVIFILIGFSNAVFITAQYASSRTMLTRITPPDQTGAFFGVYALSGVATAWLLGCAGLALFVHLRGRVSYNP